MRFRPQQELTHDQLQQVYRWIDLIPLSRPKKSIARDFADGVLMSEVVKHFFPKAVDLHNYAKTSSQAQKYANWATLNHKVFRRMNFVIHDDDIADVINHKRGSIEKVLLFVQRQLALVEAQENAAAAAAAGGGGSHGDAAAEHHDDAIAVAGPAATPAPAAAPAAAGAGAAPTAAVSSSGRGTTPATLPAISPARRGHSGNNALAKPQQQQQQQPQAPQPQQAHQPAQGDAGAVGAFVTAEAALTALQTVMGQKDATIAELRETVDILQQKVAKLEQLVKLKNTKITALAMRLDKVNLSGN